MAHIEIARTQPIGATVHLDGVSVFGVTLDFGRGRSQRPSAKLKSLDVALVDLSCIDLAPHFSRLVIGIKLDWTGLFSEAELTFPERNPAEQLSDPENETRLRFIFRPDVPNWARPFSIAQFAASMREMLSDNSPISVASADFDLGGGVFYHFSLHCAVRDLTNSVRSEIEYWLGIIHHHFEQVRVALSEEVQRDTLVTLFRFPPAVRAACEQYLVYFGQFLEDLGIQATTDLRHRDAGEVLFSVRPQDTPAGLEAALTHIHNALSAYLELPGAPEFAAAVGQNSDIAVLQLQSNVQHLQSQLTLAAAVMRAQQAENSSRASEVDYLRLSNAQLQQLIAAEPELYQMSGTASAVHSEDDPSRPEAMLGGLVTAVPYEGPGVNINVPEIVRKLKRHLGRD